MSPNSRTSIDIKMKLGPVTKLDKRNLPKSEKFSDDVMSVNLAYLEQSNLEVGF